MSVPFNWELRSVSPLRKAACDASPAASRDGWRIARLLDERRISAEAETDQRIVKFEAAAGGQRNLRCEVVARFAEQGIILVNAFLLGQPKRSRKAIDRQQGSQIVDHIILVDQVRLLLEEGACDHTEWLVRWRGHPQFLAQLLEVIGTEDVLLRIDIIARGVLEIEITEPAVSGVKLVILIGIVGIVTVRERLSVEVGTGIGDVITEVGDLAFDCQRRLGEFVPCGPRR